MSSELNLLQEQINLDPNNHELIYQYRLLLVALGKQKLAAFLPNDKVLIDDNTGTDWLPNYTWVGSIYPSQPELMPWTLDSWKNLNNTDSLWILHNNTDTVVVRSVKEVTLIEPAPFSGF